MKTFLIAMAGLFAICMIEKDNRDTYENQRNYTYAYAATIVALVIVQIFT